MSKTEIVPKEAEIVAPQNLEKLKEALKKFEEFKKDILRDSDKVQIGKNIYIKKSGWLLYAMACGLSLEMREEKIEDTSDGERIYHYTYRAIAASGRFADAVGSASSREKEKYAHEAHDVRALAQTRAMNRSIANLVGAGELSAEEMIGTDKIVDNKIVGRCPACNIDITQKDLKEVDGKKFHSWCWDSVNKK